MVRNLSDSSGSSVKMEDLHYELVINQQLQVNVMDMLERIDVGMVHTFVGLVLPLR
jgi:hypothetical protein